MISFSVYEISIVYTLLENGANVNDVTKLGFTALSIIQGQPECNEAYKMFVQKQLDNRLLNAALHGDNEEVIRVIDQGANVNHQGNDGCTPLILAITSDHETIVEILLQHKANIHIRTHSGHSALLWAAYVGRVEILKKLLRVGGNIFDKDRNGWTALAIAAMAEDAECTVALLNQGANSDVYGVTILQNMQSNPELLATYHDWIKVHLKFALFSSSLL